MQLNSNTLGSVDSVDVSNITSLKKGDKFYLDPEHSNKIENLDSLLLYRGWDNNYYVANLIDLGNMVLPSGKTVREYVRESAEAPEFLLVDVTFTVLDKTEDAEGNMVLHIDKNIIVPL
jgi:hypothetical protein